MEGHVSMRVHIYYGGRGLIEDPTISVINKITEVLSDLRVEVVRYNLYEDKNGITALPKTLKNADGVILAATVEWLGIGGLMQQFLDACWLYSDKEKIKNLYMLPVVMASTYGEREGQLTLVKAWEILGGITCDGLCAYVEDYVLFETNSEYIKIIEKKAEYFYRYISQRMKNLPSSNSAVTRNILCTTALNLTPQESEQLSVYVSDDTFVKKQKEDIRELTDMFKELLNTSEGTDTEFIDGLKRSFNAIDDFRGSFMIKFKDKCDALVITIENNKLYCSYGIKEDADVVATTTRSAFSEIVRGKNTFDRAFMSGDIIAKGDFKILRKFDELFNFKTI